MTDAKKKELRDIARLVKYRIRKNEESSKLNAGVEKMDFATDLVKARHNFIDEPHRHDAPSEKKASDNPEQP